MNLQTCRRHPGPRFLRTCPGCTQELYDLEAANRAKAAARTAAARHAACDRITCDTCGDDSDACEVTHSDARNRNECGDCHAAAEQAAVDDAEWRAYAYH